MNADRRERETVSMIPKTIWLGLVSGVLLVNPILVAGEYREIPADTLRDKIRGGLLGQILGNLNGLPHELQYIDRPGDVDDYTPALPEGAYTDDDTDFEWVYVVEMQRSGEPMLSSAAVADLWRERINRRIWCSNLYARQLMDLGIDPPLTGAFAFNPWADFNISGQFLCETFGLIAPAMPQTAARLGLNYTRVAIDGEPAQTTQLFTTMIACAFVESDLEAILDAGMAAVDPESEIHQIVRTVRHWHASHPNDWRQTRALVKETYTRHGGAMRDRNGYELNTAATIGALLYGQGDVAETLRMAFNFGWDCDNSAATAGTIVGVVRGYRWMMSQGWTIVDRYRNTTRQNMPNDETITGFADRLLDLAEQVVIRNGGSRRLEKSGAVFAIRTEGPRAVMQLQSLDDRTEALRTELADSVRHDLTQGPSAVDQARAVYLAVCLGHAEALKAADPEAWRQGVEALERQGGVLQVLFHHSPVPGAEPLRDRFRRAGVSAPPERRALWE
jgi:ADP-ribosylglycohydrolase